MNPVERVLDEEMNGLLERLSGSAGPGALEAIVARNPALRRRLDEAEQDLAAARASLLDAHGRWRRALDDLENLWALACWRSGAEEPTEQASSLAA